MSYSEKEICFAKFQKCVMIIDDIEAKKEKIIAKQPTTRNVEKIENLEISHKKMLDALMGNLMRAKAIVPEYKDMELEDIAEEFINKMQENSEIKAKER